LSTDSQQPQSNPQYKPLNYKMKDMDSSDSEDDQENLKKEKGPG
jgi:hypothetical protein